MMRRLGLLFFADFTAMELFSVAVNNLFSSGRIILIELRRFLNIKIF